MKPVSFQMKVSLACSVAILLAGAWGSRLKEQAAGRAREAERVARADRVDQPSTESPATRDSAAAAKPGSGTFDFDRLLGIAMRTQERIANGERPTPEESEEEIEMRRRMNALDPRGLEDFINRILSIETLQPNLRRLWASYAFRQLAVCDPDKALELLASNKAFYDGSPMVVHVLSDVTAEGAVVDADAAFARLERFLSEHPGVNREAAMKGAIERVIQRDRELFYRLLPKYAEPFGTGAVGSLLQAETSGADTVERALPALVYLRDYLPKVEDLEKRDKLRKQIIESLAFRSGDRGYEATQEWMKGMRLSKEEALIAGLHISNNCQPSETGSWLEWIEREMPFDSLPEAEQKTWYGQVNRMVASWADIDTVGLASWLERQQPGPMKDRGICTYIYETCERNPKEAAQWVPLLRAEENRRQVLEAILRKGRFGTTGEAEAFAREHGLR